MHAFKCIFICMQQIYFILQFFVPHLHVLTSLEIAFHAYLFLSFHMIFPPFFHFECISSFPPLSMLSILLTGYELEFHANINPILLKELFFLPACARKVRNIDKDDLFMDTHYCPFVFYSTKNKQFGSKMFIFHEKSGMMTIELVGLYQYKLC